jgi:hypothetical protein
VPGTAPGATEPAPARLTCLGGALGYRGQLRPHRQRSRHRGQLRPHRHKPDTGDKLRPRRQRSFGHRHAGREARAVQKVWLAPTLWSLRGGSKHFTAREGKPRRGSNPVSDHPANPNQRSEPTRPSRANFLLGLRNSRICRAGVALLVAEAFAEAMHTPLRALPPRQPPCCGPGRPFSPVGAADAARASCGVAPACDLPAISILPAIVPACPEETAVTHFDPLAPRPDARRMTRRRSPRRGSGREGRHHLQPPTLSMLSQLYR